MKICKKCGYENSDSLNTCENCYALLDDEKSKATSEAFFKKLDRKEKIKNIINYSLLLIYFLIVIPLYAVFVSKTGNFGVSLLLFCLFFIVIPVGYYTSVFKPDILFELSYTNVISNIADAKPSDWYYTTTLWSAYILLGFGVFIAVMLYLN